MKRNLFLFVAIILGAGALARIHSQSGLVLERAGSPLAVTVGGVSGTVESINYRHRGATRVSFAATALLSQGSGQAKVRSKRGGLEIEADFGGLNSPTAFGTEFLTYVLWAISPEGRAVNLGEIPASGGGRCRLTAITDLQAFAMIVTAEPYFAVQQPSTVVVLANAVQGDRRGVEEVDLRQEPGAYAQSGYRFDPVLLSLRLPLEFYEARNALRVAQAAGAEKYAGASYRHAVQLMKSANDYAIGKHIDRNRLIAAAREAVQTAEDARSIAVKAIDAQDRASERQASLETQQKLESQAQEAARLKEQAQTEAVNARAQVAAEQAASQAMIAAVQADAEKSRLAALEAQQREQKASSDLAAMLDKQRAQQLTDQLNALLDGRAASAANGAGVPSAGAPGVSLPDPTPNGGRVPTQPDARDTVSLLAQFLASHPGVSLSVEGANNEPTANAPMTKLPGDRTEALRKYLLEHGLSAQGVIVQGMQEALPQDNSSQPQTGRLHLVVSSSPNGATVVGLP